MPHLVQVDAQPMPTLKDNMSDGKYPVGSVSELDTTPYLGDPSYATPENTGMYQTLKRGQIVDRTTVYNPQPSDKEVEAIHGEKKYQPRANPDSAPVMRAKQLSQAAEINELKGQMAVLIAALNANIKPSESVPTKIETQSYVAPVEPVEPVKATHKPKRRKR